MTQQSTPLTHLWMKPKIMSLNLAVLLHLISHCRDIVEMEMWQTPNHPTSPPAFTSTPAARVQEPDAGGQGDVVAKKRTLKKCRNEPEWK